MSDYLIKMFIGGAVCGVIAIIICLIKKVQVKKLIYIVVFSIYIGAVLAFKLWQTPIIGMMRRINLIPFRQLIPNLKIENYHYVYQMLVNIGLFIPLGALLKIGKIRIGRSLLISFIASLGIEAVQIILNIGSFDVNDIILNSLGSFIGYILLFLIIKLIDHNSVNTIS